MSTRHCERKLRTSESVLFDRNFNFDEISLGDGIPQFEDFVGTSRSQDVVVVVVADGGDSCSVSTQGDGRLLDGHVTSLTVRQ